MSNASIAIDECTVDFPIYSGGVVFEKNPGCDRHRGAHQTGRGTAVNLGAERRVLELGHGDRLGIIGHNGAGKTTLLRVMAGVYEPTLGHVRVSGRVSTIFDFSLGLDFDATGNENIQLQGMLLGLSRRQIGAMGDEIAEFTDLGGYLEMPIRTYSAGMLTRLAFAVATAIDPEVLLMDEWIETGDAEFFHRAEARLNGLVERAGHPGAGVP